MSNLALIKNTTKNTSIFLFRDSILLNILYKPFMLQIQKKIRNIYMNYLQSFMI